jgi:hypothetical protein
MSKYYFHFISGKFKTNLGRLNVIQSRFQEDRINTLASKTNQKRDISRSVQYVLVKLPCYRKTGLLKVQVCMCVCVHLTA